MLYYCLVKIVALYYCQAIVVRRSRRNGCLLLYVFFFFLLLFGCLRFSLFRRMEVYRNSMLHNRDAFEGKTVRFVAKSLPYHAVYR